MRGGGDLVDPGAARTARGYAFCGYATAQHCNRSCPSWHLSTLGHRIVGRHGQCRWRPTPARCCRHAGAVKHRRDTPSHGREFFPQLSTALRAAKMSIFRQLFPMLSPAASRTMSKVGRSVLYRVPMLSPAVACPRFRAALTSPGAADGTSSGPSRRFLSVPSGRTCVRSGSDSRGRAGTH